MKATGAASARTADRIVSGNFLVLGGGEVIARLIAFAATVYIARTLGASYYGIIGFATAITLYLNRVVDAGVELGLGVREIAAAPHRLDVLAPALLTNRLLIAVVLVGLVGIASRLFLPQPDATVLILYSFTLLAVGLSSRWIFLGLEKTRLIALARALGEAIMVALVFALVRRPIDVTRVPVAQFAGDMVAALVMILALRSSGLKLRPGLHWPVVKPLLARSALLVASAFFGLAIYNADLIFLRFLRDAATVGYYAAAYTLISFLVNLGTAYSMSLLPTLTRLGSDRDDQHNLYHTAIAQVFALSLPIALGGTLLAPAIISLFFGSQYAASALPLQILFWAVPVALVRDVPNMALMAHGREKKIFRQTGWAAALNLLLNALLIPSFGMVGAAVATVCTETIRMVLAFVLARADGFSGARVGRLWRASVAATVMALVIVAIGASNLLLGVVVGAAAYGAGLLVLGGIRLKRGELPAINV